MQIEVAVTAMVAPRPPRATDHGESFTSQVVIGADVARVWNVLTAVSGWPTWNPLVEWTSAQINAGADKFTLLSAKTLLEAEVLHRKRERAAQLRLTTAQRPQPPAADWSVALVPQGAESTVVVAQLSIEPWFLFALQAHVQMRHHTPVSLFLGALERVLG